MGALCAPGPGTGEDFVDALDRVIDALEREAELHLLGRWITRRFLLRLLEVRLQICDAVRSDPAIRDEMIEEPVFVVGAPRTGTTILHALLAADRRHRVPRGWELLRPVPSPEPTSYDTDPRIGLADVELRMPQLVTDGLDAIHVYGGRMNKECLSAMSFSFRSEEFISRYRTPSYSQWLHSCDMTPAYEMHRLVLQILQRRFPTRRWVLKSPVHLHNLSVLGEAYPDARLIVTHRDPLAILGSVTSLLATLRWAHSDRVDTRELGAYHAELYHADLDGLVDLVDGPVAMRPVSGSGSVPESVPGSESGSTMVHTRFEEFQRDGLAVVDRVYRELGIDLPDDVRAAMGEVLSRNSRDGHGDHSWSFGWLGLDRDEQRRRFGRYTERFGVAVEI